MSSPWVLILAIALTGCTPALNWRETRTEDRLVVAMFPCRPDRHARKVALGPTTANMSLLVCLADGMTFALSSIELDDPRLVPKALTDLREAMLINLGGTLSQMAPWSVRGMTPNALAARLSAQGRLPDGTAVQQQAAIFAHGLRVYQASILGPNIDPEAAATFFEGLKLAL
jgi:hypothetical protein